MGTPDRVVLADAQGRLVDGDGILFILSQYRRQRGDCEGVVGTLMTNLKSRGGVRGAGNPICACQGRRSFCFGGARQPTLDRWEERPPDISCLWIEVQPRRVGRCPCRAGGHAENRKIAGGPCERLQVFPQKLVNVSIQSTRDLPNWSNSPGRTEAVKACAEAVAGRGGGWFYAPQEQSRSFG